VAGILTTCNASAAVTAAILTPKEGSIAGRHGGLGKEGINYCEALGLTQNLWFCGMSKCEAFCHM